MTDFSVSDGYQILEDLAKLKESDEISSCYNCKYISFQEMQVITMTTYLWFPSDKENRQKGMIPKAHQDSLRSQLFVIWTVVTIS